MREDRPVGIGRGSILFPVVALVVALVASGLALVVAGHLEHLRVPSTVAGLTPSLLAADEAGLWAAFLVCSLVGAHYYGRSSLLTYVRFRFAPSDLLVGLVVGVILQLVVVPLVDVVELVVDPAALGQLSRPAVELLGVGVGHDLAGVVALVVLGAPLFEEIFFRGLTLRLLEARMRRAPRLLATWTPSLVSALLFAVAHAGPLQFLGLFVLGVVLARLVRRTGRLGTSIVAHMAFNATAVASLLASGALVR